MAYVKCYRLQRLVKQLLFKVLTVKTSAPKEPRDTTAALRP